MQAKDTTGWTVRELSRQTGIPVSTIAWWVKSEIVKAERMGRGRGGHTIGISGLLEILAINELRRSGVSTQLIRLALEELRKQTGYERPFAHLNLVVSGDDIHWTDILDKSKMTFSALRQPGQRLMIFPIGHRCAELTSHLEGANTTSENPPFKKRVIKTQTSSKQRVRSKG